MSPICALALAAALLVAVPVQADSNLTPQQSAELQQFLQEVHAGKRQLVAGLMPLTTEEGNAFWPLYEEYQTKLRDINKRLYDALGSYRDAYNAGPVDDATAKRLLKETIAVDEAELKLRKSFVPKLEKVLPAAKVARYVQIEQKIRAAIRYELAAGIPLVE